jgi:HAD superfamily hydrolase (TIGR01549 family)
MSLQTIFWDFDGVILDSMPVRDLGFKEIFKNEPTELVEQLLVYHRQNGGLSRFVKIRYFFETLKNQTCSDELMNLYANDFSLIMRELLTDKKFLISNTIEFIAKNYQNYDCYVASGSEQNELRYLCEKLGINQYFKGIFGSPIPKKQILANVLTDNHLKPENCVMIGDAINDYEAAVANKIPFWGFHSPELKEISDVFITDFAEFSL